MFSSNVLLTGVSPSTKRKRRGGRKREREGACVGEGEKKREEGRDGGKVTLSYKAAPPEKYKDVLPIKFSTTCLKSKRFGRTQTSEWGSAQPGFALTAGDTGVLCPPSPLTHCTLAGALPAALSLSSSWAFRCPQEPSGKTRTK